VTSINFRGDLFAAAASFSAQGLIRLGSSLILTRMLQPEAYGIITILMSLVFFVEMLSDIGVTVFIVRDSNGDRPEYLNTAWTLRLARSLLNGTLLFGAAPLIAAWIYHAPALTGPLRIFSLWFVISGFESMSFPLATRRKRSRIVMYSELAATFLSTVFTIIYCSYSRNYWGMVYGILLNRLLITLMSYLYYPEMRPRPQIDRAAMRAVLKMTRFTVPSGLLTLLLSQFDKIVFLRLFSLDLLGVYGLAGSIAAPIDSLVSNICHMVLYPRCAHDFNSDRNTFVSKYYSGNTKLLISILIMPAAVGGAAHLIIALLYDPRYAQAAVILQAFMIRSALLALATPAEDLLIAAGETQVILIGSLLRAAFVVAGSLTGYYLYGLPGFAYGMGLSGLPPLLYYWRLQRNKGFLRGRYELYRVVFVVGVAICALIVGNWLLMSWDVRQIRLR